MSTIAPLNVSQLSPEEKERWHPFLEKKYWPCLDGTDIWGIDDTIIVALGAFEDNHPIGIVLSTFRVPQRYAVVLALYVEEKFRNKKIGTQLLAQLESVLVEKDCSLMSITYQSDLPTTVYLEKTLNRLGWDQGMPFSIRCHFKSSTFSASWMKNKYRLPKDIEIFKWKFLTLKERKQLELELSKETIPSSVSPFIQETLIEPSNSLGLRKKDGEVIGWMITHRVSEDTIQYASLFIKPEYQFLGYAVYLSVESIRLQMEGPIENAYLNVTYAECDNSWLRYVKNRIIPNAVKVDRFKESYRRIGNLYPEDDPERFG
jgi:GNAT superfamily N-acetyltransferase